MNNIKVKEMFDFVVSKGLIIINILLNDLGGVIIFNAC